MKDLIAKLQTNAADQILATFTTLEMQLQGFAKSSYEKDLRIAELEAELAKLRTGTQVVAEPVARLTHRDGTFDGFDIIILDRQRCIDGMALYAASTAVQAPVQQVPE